MDAVLEIRRTESGEDVSLAEVKLGIPNVILYQNGEVLSSLQECRIEYVIVILHRAPCKDFTGLDAAVVRYARPGLDTITVGADISWNAAAVVVALCVIIWKLDGNSN